MSLLVLFCCCYLCLRRQIQTNIAMIFGKKMFCPCFLLSFLWFPALACRSLIHFEFIFVCGVRKCSNFILLRVAVQFFYSSCFCVSTILSDFCSFVVQFEVRELCFFPQDCLAIWGLWWFYINFLIICSSSVKTVMSILMRIALNLQSFLGTMDILTILIFQSKMGYLSFFGIIFILLYQCFIVFRVQVFQLLG